MKEEFQYDTYVLMVYGETSATYFLELQFTFKGEFYGRKNL
jgi:hypothetical protein